MHTYKITENETGTFTQIQTERHSQAESKSRVKHLQKFQRTIEDEDHDFWEQI